MSFDFNTLNSITPISYDDMDVMTISGLRKRFNDVVKAVGLEFEENDFTLLVSKEEAAESIYKKGQFMPKILCAAQRGNNEGYYIYVYLSTPTSVTPILSAKGWTWQNMVAIQAVITSMLRLH